ncbi:MAG: recombination mediator RecR [Victivallales bacterium]|nr:recombination mediator RecR [Victivallales bacterium]
MNGAEYPEALEELIELLKSLPGIGRRSAERLALALLQWPPEKLAVFGDLMRELPVRITFCPECGNLAADGGLCPICRAPSRDRSVICVVEQATQIINIEKSGLYHGLYHVLGGKLAPLEGKNPADLNLETLPRRIDAGPVGELVLALSSDVEGRATAAYIAGMLAGKGLRITRLASGLPAGSDISYADPETLAAAFSGRIVL